MKRLRERGIYVLPDGREFVVHAVFRGGYVFYTPENWDLFRPHSYESNADGQISRNGQVTTWNIEDLIDTTRMVRSRKTVGAHGRRLLYNSGPLLPTNYILPLTYTHD